MKTQPVRHIHLDMLRGLAALAVVVGHVRGFLLIDHGDLVAPALWHKPFYFLGGLGHQAVIAFFALSGYLVGGQALKRILAGPWSWPEYLIARLSRLWTVVIPALALTFVLDVAGWAICGGTGYDGSYYGILSSGPTLREPVDHSLWALASNLLFLQTIISPIFGSNGPLWSLANEFWYYVVFPLAAVSIWGRASPGLRLLSGFVAFTLSWLLPLEMMLLGAVWVAGALACHLGAQTEMRRIFRHSAYRAATALAIIGSVLTGFGQNGWLYDLILGFAWAALLPLLTTMTTAPVRASGLYESVAKGLSEISYTLYATHFPILSFVYFVGIAPRQWSPGFEVLGLGAGMLALSLGISTSLWWCFERNTPVVKAMLVAMLRQIKA